MSKKAPLSLEGNLERLAGKILGNTHMIPERMRDKIRLIGDVYGRAVVIEDFETYCRALTPPYPRYPIIEYVKDVDSRLGGAAETKHPNIEDPNVEQVRALVYDAVGILPSKTPIAKLLVDYSHEEIAGAFLEYVETLKQSDFEMGVRKFFNEGGAVAVIFVRRKRANDQNRKNQQATE